MTTATVAEATPLKSNKLGKKNIVIGLWAMALFMFLGFALVYLRDFAPDAQAWAASYATGKHFETRLAHVHGTLFGFLNIVIGYLLYQMPLCDKGSKIVSGLALTGLLMPIGILGEVLLGTSPIFVLAGATAMTLSIVLLGVGIYRHH